MLLETQVLLLLIQSGVTQLPTGGGSTSVGGTLGVTGASTLSNTLDVTGKVKLYNELSVLDNVFMSNNLSVQVISTQIQ